jgi:hypothetical protein
MIVCGKKRKTPCSASAPTDVEIVVPASSGGHCFLGGNVKLGNFRTRNRTLSDGNTGRSPRKFALAAHSLGEARNKTPRNRSWRHEQLSPAIAEGYEDD